MLKTETHPGPSLAEYDAEHPLEDLDLRRRCQGIAPNMDDAKSLYQIIRGLQSRIEKMEAAQPRKAYRPDLEQSPPPAKTRGQEVADQYIRKTQGGVSIFRALLESAHPIATEDCKAGLAALIDAERADAAKQERERILSGEATNEILGQIKSVLERTAVAG